MNCKKGDLAWVIVPPRERHTPWGEKLHMAIVLCEEHYCNPKTGEPMWKVSPQITTPCRCGNPDHYAVIEAIADKVMRPIRGDKLPGDHVAKPVEKPVKELEPA